MDIINFITILIMNYFIKLFIVLMIKLKMKQGNFNYINFINYPYIKFNFNSIK